MVTKTVCVCVCVWKFICNNVVVSLVKVSKLFITEKFCKFNVKRTFMRTVAVNKDVSVLYFGKMLRIKVTENI